MNADVKQDWIEALRSGEFSQSRSQLRDFDGHCCLGVLCELHSRATGTPWKRTDTGGYRYLGSQTLLPEEVRVWAGLPDCNPIVGTDVREPLTALNDFGKSFAHIAEQIEEHF